MTVAAISPLSHCYLAAHMKRQRGTHAKWCMHDNSGCCHGVCVCYVYARRPCAGLPTEWFVARNPQSVLTNTGETKPTIKGGGKQRGGGGESGGTEAAASGGGSKGAPTVWRKIAKGAFSLGGNLPPVRSNAQLHKGLFSESLPPFLATRPPTEPVRYASIDMDLYQGAIDVLRHLEGRFVSATTALTQTGSAPLARGATVGKCDSIGTWAGRSLCTADCNPRKTRDPKMLLSPRPRRAAARAASRRRASR